MVLTTVGREIKIMIAMAIVCMPTAPAVSLLVTRCRFRAEALSQFGVLEIDGCVHRKIAQYRITGQTKNEM